MNGGFPVYIEYNEVERRSSKAKTMLGTQHGGGNGPETNAGGGVLLHGCHVG